MASRYLLLRSRSLEVCMTVWMQQVEEGGLERLMQGLELMPGFMYLHLLDDSEDPRKLLLIYWKDEISMRTWHSLIPSQGDASIYSLQRSFGPDVI